jgi:hypothetical protein
VSRPALSRDIPENATMRDRFALIREPNASRRGVSFEKRREGLNPDGDLELLRKTRGALSAALFACRFGEESD